MSNVYFNKCAHFLAFAVIILKSIPHCQGFAPLSMPQNGCSLISCQVRPWPIIQTTIYASSATNDEEERQKLLDMASKLREEAGALEDKLRMERGSSNGKSRPEPTIPPIKYERIGASTWTLTYRFADQPAKDEQENEKPVTFYRGKLSLQFKPDGYTELVDHQGVDKASTINVVKVWGWDEEYSQEDSERYVLFSMDATTPNNPDKPQRFYFQARLEQGEKKGISLKEGTVTIKQDLAQSKGIMNMGFFSAQGILAQFRYVGDFIAKPTSGN